jgi:hypothetical protein
MYCDVTIGFAPVFLTPGLGGMMISEVSGGQTEVHAGVQARGGEVGQRACGLGAPGGGGSRVTREPIAQMGQERRGPLRAGVPWSGADAARRRGGCPAAAGIGRVRRSI